MLNYRPPSCPSSSRLPSIFCFEGIINIHSLHVASFFFRAQFRSPLSSVIIVVLGNLHTHNKATYKCTEQMYRTHTYVQKIDLYMQRYFACAVVTATEARHTAVPSANARSANTTRGGDGSSGSTWTSRIGASCRSSGTDFRVRGFARSRTDARGGRRGSWFDRCRTFPVDARQA